MRTRDAPAGAQSAVCFALSAARHRAEAGKAVRPADRTRRRAAAPHRSAVSHADGIRRPAQPAEALRRPARHPGHRRGHCRPPPAAAAEPAALAVPHLCERRDERSHHHLLQCAPGLSAQALPRRGEALCVGHRRVLRRPPADGAPRSRGGRGGFRQPAADRSRLSAHRGPASEPVAQGDRPRARTPAQAPRMAGWRVAPAQRLSGLRRRAAQHPPPGDARRPQAGQCGMVTACL